ncbi:MAG: hypothetical protein IT430_19955 [Phycisphaerales bacterium]|nr:hypothetical protein [Phycisphaerales bacterium]
MKSLLTTVFPVVPSLVLTACAVAQSPAQPGDPRAAAQAPATEPRVSHQPPAQAPASSGTNTAPGAGLDAAPTAAAGREALNTDIARLNSLAGDYDPAANRARLSEDIRRAIQELRDELGKLPRDLHTLGQTPTSILAAQCAVDTSSQPTATVTPATETTTATSPLLSKQLELITMIARRMDAIENRVDRLEAGAAPVAATGNSPTR